jgi:hypothetical protein
MWLIKIELKIELPNCKKIFGKGILSDVFIFLQNLGFISCDTLEVIGDTQMCRDTQFEKHCSNQIFPQIPQ